MQINGSTPNGIDKIRNVPPPSRSWTPFQKWASGFSLVAVAAYCFQVYLQVVGYQSMLVAWISLAIVGICASLLSVGFIWMRGWRFKELLSVFSVIVIIAALVGLDRLRVQVLSSSTLALTPPPLLSAPSVYQKAIDSPCSNIVATSTKEVTIDCSPQQEKRNAPKDPGKR